MFKLIRHLLSRLSINAHNSGSYPIESFDTLIWPTNYDYNQNQKLINFYLGGQCPICDGEDIEDSISSFDVNCFRFFCERCCHVWHIFFLD